MDYNDNVDMKTREGTEFTETDFQGNGPFDNGEDPNISIVGEVQDGNAAQENTTQENAPEKANRKVRKKKDNPADVLPDDEPYVGPNDEGDSGEYTVESGYEGETPNESDEPLPEETGSRNVTPARSRRTSQRRHL